MTRIPMSAADTEAARATAQAAITRAASAVREGGASVPHPATPPTLNPRRRALMEMADRQAEIIASAAAVLLDIHQMIRDLPMREMPPQRPDPAGVAVPLVKAPPLVFGSPAVPATPPPGTAGDDAPTRTECADTHPLSGD